MKVFVISAAVMRTPLRSFALVVLLGRTIRYFGEAWLGAALGEGSLPFLRAHTWAIAGGAVAVFAALYGLAALNDRRRRRLEDGRAL